MRSDHIRSIGGLLRVELEARVHGDVRRDDDLVRENLEIIVCAGRRGRARLDLRGMGVAIEAPTPALDRRSDRGEVPKGMELTLPRKPETNSRRETGERSSFRPAHLDAGLSSGLELAVQLILRIAGGCEQERVEALESAIDSLVADDLLDALDCGHV